MKQILQLMKKKKIYNPALWLSAKSTGCLYHKANTSEFWQQFHTYKKLQACY